MIFVLIATYLLVENVGTSVNRVDPNGDIHPETVRQSRSFGKP
jgi:hypothetical protein